MAYKKMFDGTQEDMETFSFVLNDMEFRISSFINNPLRNLVEKLIVSREEFERVIAAGNFHNNGSLIKNYYSQDNLEVYYLIDNDQIYLFAFGEFQPMRFMLHVQGIWKTIKDSV